jgi:hypothetical protein
MALLALSGAATLWGSQPSRFDAAMIMEAM